MKQKGRIMKLKIMLTVKSKVAVGVDQYPLQITTDDIRFALFLLIPEPDLLEHAISEGEKACARFKSNCEKGQETNIHHMMLQMRRYRSSKDGTNTDHINLNKKTETKKGSRDNEEEPPIRLMAGLLFFPSPIHNFLIHRLNFNVHPLVSVFLAGTLEYLAAEILELGGNATREARSRRVTSEFLTTSIFADDSLTALFGPHSTILPSSITYRGEWSWRPRYIYGGLGTLPFLNTKLPDTTTAATMVSTSDLSPLSLRYSLFEYVCRSFDYLAMIGSQLSRMKLQEDEWRRYYLNHYYSSTQSIHFDKKETKEIGSSSSSSTSTSASTSTSTATATLKWRDILIDVYDPTSLPTFVYTRPSTTIFPTDDKQEHHHYDPLTTSTLGHTRRYVIPTIIRLSAERRVGDAAVVNDQYRFIDRWNELSQGMFIGFDWANVFAAGLLALPSLLSLLFASPIT
jgi:hypothetical protein